MENGSGSTRKPADVGVLFVHGLGEQQRAETLVRGGEALQTWLERWLNPDGTRTAIRISHANLSQTPPQERPAHAEMHITAPGIDTTWLLAESWWAASFRAPRYADLWRWSFEVVPLAVAEHFVRSYRLAEGLHRKAVALLFAGVAIAMLPLFTMVLVTSLVLGVLPIPQLRTAILHLQKILIGTVGDSYTLLESSIRDAAMSSCVRRDLEWLQTVSAKTVVVAHSQGAAVAHAALQSPDVRQPDLLFTFGSGLRKLLLLDAVRGNERFVAWLPPLGLLLMALGSWLIYRLVVDPTARVDWSLYQGVDVRGYLPRGLGVDITSWPWVAGIGALVGAILPQFAVAGSTWVERLAIGAMVGVFASCLALLIKAVLTAGPPGYIAFALVNGGGLLLGRGLSVFELGRTDALVDTRLEPDSQVKWIDRYATADPVPNGPLTSKAKRFVDSQPVWNLGSPLRDHSAYWYNQDQFVPAVAQAIASIAGLDLAATREWDKHRLRRAEDRRRWRVMWLKASRVLAYVVTAVLVLRFQGSLWRQPDELPGPLGTLFMELLDLVERIPFLRLLVAEWTKSALVQALGLLSVLACFWLICRLFLVAWSWWDRAEMESLFDRGDYALLPIPFVGLLATFGIVMAVTTIFATFFDRELVRLWSRDASLLALRSDFWKGAIPASSQGALAAIALAALTTWVVAGVATAARSWWAWGNRTEDTVTFYIRFSGYAVLVLTLALPATWILFDLGADPQQPYEWAVLRWLAAPAFGGIIALGLLLVALWSATVDSRIAGRLVDLLNQASASGRLGSWLARAALGDRDVRLPLLSRRAREMVSQWRALEAKARTVSVAAAYNEEASALVRVLAPPSAPEDRDLLFAMTDEFPYAALAAAEIVSASDAAIARRILDPHRETSPPAVRRRIRWIERRLGRGTVSPIHL